MCIIRMCMILIIELKLGIDNGKIALVYKKGVLKMKENKNTDTQKMNWKSFGRWQI